MRLSGRVSCSVMRPTANTPQLDGLGESRDELTRHCGRNDLLRGGTSKKKKMQKGCDRRQEKKEKQQSLM